MSWSGGRNNESNGKEKAVHVYLNETNFLLFSFALMEHDSLSVKHKALINFCFIYGKVDDQSTTFFELMLESVF